MNDFQGDLPTYPYPSAKKTQAILSILNGMPLLEALQELNKVEHVLLTNSINAALPFAVMARQIPRSKRGRLTKIESDSAVEAFVLELQNLSYFEIVARCRKRFGQERAPSKSGIGRYFKKMNRLIYDQLRTE